MKIANQTQFGTNISLTTLMPDGERPTVALIARDDAPANAPLLLVGHGGAGHKLDDAVRALALSWLSAHPMRLLAVDGPVHGARRSDGATDRSTVLPDFDAAWRAGSQRLQEALLDWQQVVVELPELGIAPSRIGYWGLSMGTALGLPLCASLPQLSVALLGMWSSTFANSAHLITHAQAISAPTLFIARMQDPLFGWDAQVHLFDALGSSNKCLLALPGGHVPLDADSELMAAAFFQRHLFGQNLP